ncbi:MAG TPA: glycosyltransferase family 4 protein [Tepidisphaeraceae bacterium]|jgi:glycosyltransferase involved in cell wall biosynthesis|nr:glycosyltransferase family 4 protein [Tepidisphaeraceae bacterium]
MRIVFLNPVGVLGGGERSLLDLIAAIRARDPSTDVHLIVGTDGPLVAHAHELGANVHVLPMPSTVTEMGDSALRGGRISTAVGLAMRGIRSANPFRRYLRELRRTLRSLEPAIIHSNGIKTHIVGRLAAPKGVPVIWHIRDFISTRPLVRRMLSLALNDRVTLVANSKAVASDLKVVLSDANNVEVVYNAIDTQVFSPGPGDGKWLDELAGREPVDGDVVRVGLIATFARWKGQGLFIEAAAQLLKDQPNLSARFFVIGGPIYRTAGSQFTLEELTQLAESNGLGRKIGFVPFQKHPADVYRALDVVVHASTLPEPFGRTIVEAMSCGRPVIVSKAGGAAELFDDGQDALGVPANDCTVLSSAMGQLISDALLRRRLGEAARETAIARFDRSRLGDDMIAVYDKIIKNR